MGKAKKPYNQNKVKKRLRSEADKLWHLAVIKKYGDQCFFANSYKKSQNCLGTTTKCHHFKAKGQYGHMRYLVENGVPACWPCHFKLEQVDKTMIIDIIESRGKKWYNKIEEIAKEKHYSYQTIEWYRENIKRLKYGK